MQVDVSFLRVLVERGYLSCRQHPAAKLLIWNYTANTQHAGYWIPETLMCRGLITDAEGKVLYRPFGKFFNLEEFKGQLPNEPFEVTEKVDGSLGILYDVDGEQAIATRGSFDSPQAIRGTEILRRKYGRVIHKRGLTLLYEIIFPENRIVVDYGAREDLVFLAAIDTETGRDVSMCPPPLFPAAKRYDGIHDIAKLKELGEKGSEGFVIRFLESNLRLKVKLDEYKRLHRLMCCVTPGKIWEVLASGGDLNEMLDLVPDEYYQWVRDVEFGIRLKAGAIANRCGELFARAPQGSRKDFAEYAKQTEYPSVLFCMLDGKDIWSGIWKLVRPVGRRPFRGYEE